MTAAESALMFAERTPESTRTRTITWQDPMPTAALGAEMAGIDYMRAAEGSAVFAGEPGEEHYNPIGVVHGGYASTLLDSAMGCAVHTTLPAGSAYTTQTIEVKLVRPITRDSGTLRCEAEVLHRGRRQATVAARLLSADGKLLAHGTSTCMILES